MPDVVDSLADYLLHMDTAGPTVSTGSPVPLARRGYTAEPVTVNNIDLYHLFHMGDFGRECVGTAITPAVAYTKLERQQWPTHIDPILCLVCATPEPTGGF